MFPELIGESSNARPGIVAVSRRQTLDSFLSDRGGDAGNRRRFACAIISNPEPTRMKAIEMLGRIGTVDVMGDVTGIRVKDKFEILANYRFALCFENDLYPGYVTEKVFDAWAAGAIPLWWGIDREQSLNKSSILNLAEHQNMDSFLAQVSNLNNQPEVLNKVSSRALLKVRPNLDAVRATLSRALLTQIGTQG